MIQQQVEYWNNYIFWYLNKKSHRDGDLPARYSFEYVKSFAVSYYQHDKLHRATGPAIIDYEDKIKRYYYQSTEYDSLEQIQMLEACK